jgi:hypothetical protein
LRPSKASLSRWQTSSANSPPALCLDHWCGQNPFDRCVYLVTVPGPRHQQLFCAGAQSDHLQQTDHWLYAQ